jgi:hypothetical protein
MPGCVTVPAASVLSTEATQMMTPWPPPSLSRRRPLYHGTTALSFDITTA